MSFLRKLPSFATILVMSLPALAQNQFDIIIRNGRVLDGSGNPWFRGDIAVQGDRIVAIGDLHDVKGQREIDANDLYIAPGFIDSHSHAADGLASPDRSRAHGLLTQGVTTVFINPDGGGPVDLAEQQKDLLKDGLGVNAAQLVPHGGVRRQVLGMANRLANPDELESMKALVRQGMLDGGFGLSSGPFYAPGSYSDTAELVALAKIAAQFGGAYTSHIRDESNYTIGVVAAVDEVIQISREANLPGVITHIKTLGPPVWGFSQALVRRIERARDEGLQIYADQYPYTASATSLAAALLPRWAQAGGRDSLTARLQNQNALREILAAMKENLARRGGPDRIQFRYFAEDQSVEGRLLSEVAAERKMTPIETAVKMFQQGEPGIVSFNMHDDDVRTLMTQPWMMTSSDGRQPKWGVGSPHPRAFGAFPRKIRKYVVEEGVVSLAAAIRSMTSLPAQVFRLADRGVLRSGAFADIVVFDLERLRDRATFTEPYQLSEGVVHVFVNGRAAMLDEEFTGELAGRTLKLHKKRSD